jgi:hypothetical protein
MSKTPIGKQNSLWASFQHLPETPSHTTLLKVRGCVERSIKYGEKQQPKILLLKSVVNPKIGGFVGPKMIGSVPIPALHQNSRDKKHIQTLDDYGKKLIPFDRICEQKNTGRICD